MSDADEMILAGSRPNQGNPIDALHKRTSFVLLIDALVFSMLVYLFSGMLELAVVPGIFTLVVWMAYRKKASWAYWFAPMIMGGITLAFSLLLFQGLMYLFTGQNSSFFTMIILAWAIFSSVRFIRIHFHPVYKMGYSGHSVYDEEITLQGNEMLAACPTCLAVLAVNPILLSPKDSCPHCDSPLVTSAVLEEE
tara:strand:- start:1759 stop:2340 length:582 start_codon:yes stop_codon:yes gene_type:complete